MNAQTGQVIAYLRVSTTDQHLDRQETITDGASKVFREKASGGTRDERPVLNEMIAYAREGDTVRVYSLDRLGRNSRDLHNLVHELVERGIAVEFVKENMRLSNAADSSSMDRMMFSMFGAFAQFERDLMKERQREGIEAAKQRGAYKGRKRAYTDEMIETAKQRVAAGIPKTVIARDLNVSRQTLYKMLR